MKATQKPGEPSVGAEGPADPDFNDSLTSSGMRADPEASEFRDELQVGSYASVGALQSEMDRERQEAEQATLDALEAMRGMDAGDQVKWRISRTGHENDELNGFLETWPNHLMTIERLRDRFGGGSFWCKGFRNGRYMAHKTLQISGEAKRKPNPDMTGSLPVAPAGPQFDVQSFLTAQERRDERRREQERIEAREREERDEKRRGERMQLLLTLGPAAITALGGLFQGRPDNTAALVAALKPPDLLTTMTQLKALQGNSQDGVLTKILPMIIDMAGSKAAGGDTGWLDIVKEFAKSAGPAMSTLIQNQLAAPAGGTPAGGIPGMTVTPVGSGPIPALAQPAALARPAIVVPESYSRRERSRRTAPEVPTAGLPADHSPGRPAATAASPSPRSNSMPAANGQGVSDMNLFSLMPHLPWLKDLLSRMWHAASRGKDPEVYAALFLEEVPEEIDANMIVGLLGPDSWFQLVCQVEPRWNDSRVYPWIEHVRKLILNQVYGPMSGAAPVSPAGQAAGTAQAGSGTGVSQAGTPSPGPSAARRTSGEIDRPTRLPSLTGD